MKALTNYRYYVLFALAIISFVGLFSEPSEDLSSAMWLLVLITTKVLGIVCVLAISNLATRWQEEGKLPEITELFKL